MKKFFAIMLFVLLALSAVSVFAQDIDLASMSFDELEALKAKVDYEYNSREEVEPVTLPLGDNYYVGKDIAPGRYWIYQYKVGDNTRAFADVYDENDEKVKSFYFSMGDAPEQDDLEEGWRIRISYGPVTFSKKEVDPIFHYDLEFPEGTTVPAGTYIVGEDIPVGSYTAYPSTPSYTDVFIFENESVSMTDEGLIGNYRLRYDPSNFGLTFKLNEGNVFLVKSPIIMTKAAALNF